MPQKIQKSHGTLYINPIELIKLICLGYDKRFCAQFFALTERTLHNKCIEIFGLPFSKLRSNILYYYMDQMNKTVPDLTKRIYNLFTALNEKRKRNKKI